MEYQDLDFFEGPPTWKYPVEQPPRLGVIIDDCLGTPLLSKPSAGLVNMCIKHRHLGKGLGISIFMLVQSYCAQGGINRAIRKKKLYLAAFIQVKPRRPDKEVVLRNRLGYDGGAVHRHV